METEFEIVRASFSLSQPDFEHALNRWHVHAQYERNSGGISTEPIKVTCLYQGEELTFIIRRVSFEENSLEFVFLEYERRDDVFVNVLLDGTPSSLTNADAALHAEFVVSDRDPLAQPNEDRDPHPTISQLRDALGI